jgi:hypothetical protein
MATPVRYHIGKSAAEYIDVPPGQTIGDFITAVAAAHGRDDLEVALRQCTQLTDSDLVEDWAPMYDPIASIYPGADGGPADPGLEATLYQCPQARTKGRVWLHSTWTFDSMFNGTEVEMPDSTLHWESQTNWTSTSFCPWTSTFPNITTRPKTLYRSYSPSSGACATASMP